MSTITKERVAGIARGEKCYTHDDVVELARIALASLEAEAVAYIRDGFRADGVHFCGGIITAEEHERTKPALSDRYTWKHQPLYTAPPAPVSVPDRVTYAQSEKLGCWDGWESCSEAWADGWNACRDAMLQGADGNSPVIPDGWVLVPMQPTEEMCDVGHVGVDVLTGVTDGNEYYSIDGENAAKVYRAMIAAAPQQEVK